MESAMQFTPAEIEQIAREVGVVTPSDPWWPHMGQCGHEIHEAQLKLIKAALSAAEQIMANRP
jgi:hypothetical protein